MVLDPTTALRSPGSSSGYGSAEEDHSLRFPFPVPYLDFDASDSNQASPFSDSGTDSSSFPFTSGSLLPVKPDFRSESLEGLLEDIDLKIELPNLDLTSGFSLTATDHAKEIDACGQFADHSDDQDIDYLEELCDYFKLENDLLKFDADVCLEPASAAPPVVQVEPAKSVDTKTCLNQTGQRDNSVLILLLSDNRSVSNLKSSTRQIETNSVTCSNQDLPQSGIETNVCKTGSKDNRSLLCERTKFQVYQDQSPTTRTRTSFLADRTKSVTDYISQINSPNEQRTDNISSLLLGSSSLASSSSSSSLAVGLGNIQCYKTSVWNRSTSIPMEQDQRAQKRTHTVPLPTKKPAKIRRSCSELDDHGYSTRNPNSNPLPPPKLAKTGADCLASRSRQQEKSILETFLLTKEALHANKGSDGMLAEGKIARLYSGDSVKQYLPSAAPEVSKPRGIPGNSVLKTILTNSGRKTKEDDDTTSRREMASAVPHDVNSESVATSIETNSTDSNYEFYAGKFEQAPDALQLGFFCEDLFLPDQGWSPSCEDDKIFSSEMDAIINGQKNEGDVWMHQYITDLL